MISRRRRIAASLLLVAGLATLSQAAFHEGISGSSLRHENRWSHRQQSRNLQTLTGSSSAQESCEASRVKEEADIAPGGGVSKCTCKLSLLDERYEGFWDLENQPVVWELSCVDQRCDYCSPDGSTCDRFSYGALFEEVKVRRGEVLEDGVVQVAYYESNQYVVGRPEVVTYTEYSDPANPGSHACSMSIDGLECAVCEYVDCMGSEEKQRDVGDINVYYGLNVVCNNIMIDGGNGEYVSAADFQTCDPDFITALGQGQGVFEMYDPEYGQCFTSAEGCARDQVELEQTGYYECGCVDNPDQGVSPFLENVMLDCKLAKGISHKDELCNTLQQDTVQRTFSAYAEEANTRTIQLESGSILVLEEFDCLTTKGMVDGCHQCKASVDGTECSSCEMMECEGSNSGHLAASIACGNALAELGTSTINLCDPESSKGTPFEAFSVCGFEEHAKISEQHGPQPVSLMACSRRLREISQSVGSFVDNKLLSCECLLVDTDPSMDAGTMLECRSSDATCGSVCNAEYNDVANENQGLCFREELVEGFLPNGSSTPITRTTTYTHGTEDVGRTLVLTEFGNGSKGCQLMVDGESCNSCRLKNCGEEIGIRPLVDCSNVDASLNLDTCGAFDSYQDGLLMRFTAGASDSAGQDFSFCRDESSGDFSISKDRSLPKTCDQATPIALPTREDDPYLVSKDILNPNSMFAFVSFVASTEGLSPANNELSSVQETCNNVQEGYANSPGLWYSLVGSGKGVHASVCREATDFDARISVYEGSCDEMHCVTTSPLKSAVHSPCDVHWVAEEGLTYHIRVHGTDESQTGTFNLFMETLDNDVTSTCYSVETGDFDNACLSCNKAQTMRIQQFENDPAEIDCQCIYNPGMGGYHLTCVDMSCLKCNGRQDLCGFNTVEQDIQLSGESPYGSYESFYYTDKADGAQAIEIVDIQNSECLEIHDPYQQCLMAKEEVMAREEAALEDFPFFCECRQTSPNGHHMLICSLFDAFEFCVDEENDMCVNQLLFGQSISHYGTVTSEFRNFRIQPNESGLADEKSIMIERLSDTCFASINGESCSSCELVQSCVDNRQGLDVLDIASTGIDENIFTDMSVDCSNLVENAVFECGRTKETNLLSVLSGKVSQKESYSITSLENQTIPPNAFPPTMAPVSRPTSPPVDPPSWQDNSIIIDTPTDNVVLEQTVRIQGDDRQTRTRRCEGVVQKERLWNRVQRLLEARDFLEKKGYLKKFEKYYDGKGETSFAREGEEVDTTAFHDVMVAMFLSDFVYCLGQFRKKTKQLGFTDEGLKEEVVLGESFDVDNFSHEEQSIVKSYEDKKGAAFDPKSPMVKLIQGNLKVSKDPNARTPEINMAQFQDVLKYEGFQSVRKRFARELTITALHSFKTNKLYIHKFDAKYNDKNLVYCIAGRDRDDGTGETDLFLTFRGSVTGRDWIANLQAPLVDILLRYDKHRDRCFLVEQRTFQKIEIEKSLYVEFSKIVEEAGYPLRVHKGFLGYLFADRGDNGEVDEDKNDDSMYTNIRLNLQRLTVNNSLHVTGHSLGGALATLASFFLASDKEINNRSTDWGGVKCISFAAPMVGNVSFQRAFEVLQTKKQHQSTTAKTAEGERLFRNIRITNNRDIVPLVPFFSKYRHTGGVHIHLN